MSFMMRSRAAQDAFDAFDAQRVRCRATMMSARGVRPMMQCAMFTPDALRAMMMPATTRNDDPRRALPQNVDEAAKNDRAYGNDARSATCNECDAKRNDARRARCAKMSMRGSAA